MGMDPAKTATALKYGRVRAGSGNLIRSGRRIGYWGDQGTKYHLQSTTKSIVSILIGIAIRERRISLDSLLAGRVPNFGVPPTANRAKGLAGRDYRSPTRHAERRFQQDGGVRALVVQAGQRMVLQRRRAELDRRSVDGQVRPGPPDGAALARVGAHGDPQRPDRLAPKRLPAPHLERHRAPRVRLGHLHERRRDGAPGADAAAPGSVADPSDRPDRLRPRGRIACTRARRRQVSRPRTVQGQSAVEA